MSNYDASTGQMTFSLALEELKKGRKLRMACWPEGQWVELKDGRMLGENGEECHLTTASLIAADWVEVIEQESNAVGT